MTPTTRGITKKQIATFNNAVLDYFLGLGASIELRSSYDLILETRHAGALLVSANGNWVAMRFTDVDLARKWVPSHGSLGPTCRATMNRFSGKYNVHFNTHHSTEHVISVLQSMLERVM